jgi:hypothetical protein
MSPSEPHGQAALMLCESLLHLLVEEGVITKTKARLKGWPSSRAKRPSTTRAGSAAALVETIVESFAAKEKRQVAKPKSMQLSA